MYEQNTCAQTGSCPEIAGTWHSSRSVSSDIFRCSYGLRMHRSGAVHAQHSLSPFLVCPLYMSEPKRGLEVRSIFRQSIKVIARCDSCVCLWDCGYASALAASSVVTTQFIYFPFPLLSMCKPAPLIFPDKMTPHRHRTSCLVNL